MKINKIFSKVRTFHRWLAIIVGIQLLFWTLSGLVMSYLPLDEVRGNHLFSRTNEPKLNISKYRVDVLSEISKKHLSLRKIVLKNFMQQPVYEVHGDKEEVVLYNAHTGKRISPLGEDLALQIAADQFTGNYDHVQALLMQGQNHSFWENTEFRGPFPVWKVSFDDKESTRFYISPQTGKLLAIRNDRWRLFDFVWMFHILDFSEREDFNHPTLVISAFFALLMTLSGIYLVITIYKRKYLR